MVVDHHCLYSTGISNQDIESNLKQWLRRSPYKSNFILVTRENSREIVLLELG